MSKILGAIVYWFITSLVYIIGSPFYLVLCVLLYPINCAIYYAGLRDGGWPYTLSRDGGWPYNNEPEFWRPLA